MAVKDQQLNRQLDEIDNNQNLSIPRKRIAAARAIREAIVRLHNEGKTVTEICVLTGIRESRVRELTGSLTGSKTEEGS